MQVANALVAILQKRLYVIPYVFQVLLLLLLLLSLVHPLRLVYILYNRRLMLIGLVPILYPLHSLYKTELFIINIGVMSNSNEGLVNVSLWKQHRPTILNRPLILLLKLSTQSLYVLVH